MADSVASALVVRTPCIDCATSVYSVPERLHDAMCFDCRRTRTGVDWEWLTAVGEWHPTVSFYGTALGVERSEPDAHPAPEVSTRDPRPESVSEPTTVTDLAVYASARGWAVSVAYSRGNGVHGTTGRPTALAEYWSVRFGRGGYAGYAVRRGGAWSSVAVRGLDLPPFLAMGVTELKQWLEQPERPAQWYSDIVTRREEQKAAARQSAKARPKKQRESGG